MKKIRFTSIRNSNPNNHNTWVCSLCYPFAMELGDIWGCGSLIYMANHPLDTLAPKEYGEGKFALLGGQGHRDGELVIFNEKPRVEYVGEFNIIEYHPNPLNITLNDALHLYEKTTKYGGYNEEKHGYNFELFFIQKIHQLINRWEKKNGNLETFYKKFVKEREIYLLDKNK
jgi:hypothetical protein